MTQIYAYMPTPIIWAELSEKVSTSSARREGITYGKMCECNVILGSRSSTERLGGAESDWGQETLPRSMNESRLFLAVT